MQTKILLLLCGANVAATFYFGIKVVKDQAKRIKQLSESLDVKSNTIRVLKLEIEKIMSQMRVNQQVELIRREKESEKTN